MLSGMKLHDTRHVERAILVQVVRFGEDALQVADSLLELGRLAETAGFEVAGELVQNRIKPDGGTMIGSMFVVDFPSREAIESDWLRSEPYVVGNVWERIEVHRAQSAPFLRQAGSS